MVELLVVSSKLPSEALRLAKGEGQQVLPHGVCCQVGWGQRTPLEHGKSNGAGDACPCVAAGGMLRKGHLQAHHPEP